MTIHVSLTTALVVWQVVGLLLAAPAAMWIGAADNSRGELLRLPVVVVMGPVIGAIFLVLVLVGQVVNLLDARKGPRS